MEVAVLVPIKSFADAKGRLADALSPAQRAELARAMAAGVIRAARPHPTFIACDDDEVADWVAGGPAEVLWTPGLGLNGAIEHGVSAIAAAGADHVIISHGDLPLATSFDHLCVRDTVTLVPDRRLDGTNVQARPAASFTARYGPASFRNHVADALALGHRVRVVTDRQLGFDVDTIDDLTHPDVRAAVKRLLPGAIADIEQMSS